MVLRIQYNQEFLEVTYNKTYNQSLIIYGIDQTANEIFDILTSINIIVDYFCDPAMERQEHRGVKVIKTMDLVMFNESIIIIAIDTFNMRPIKDLFKNGVNSKNIGLLRERELQYFGRPNLSADKNEVFIDAGAFDGRIVLDFIEWCGGNYKKFFSFEPDINNY